MGFRNKLLGRDGKPAPEQAVIVHFQYGLPDLQPLFALEHRLESAINSAGVGEYK